MARAGRKDRGLLSKPDSTGKPVWYVRLYHEGRDRRFGSFPNKTKAREFYEKAKLEQKEGRFFPERYQHGGYSLVEELIAAHVNVSTVKNQSAEKHYGQWWKDRLRGKRLNAVTPPLLEQAQRELMAEGLAPQTVMHYMKFLRHIMNKAVRDGKMEKNPFTHVKLPRVATGKTRFLTQEEEAALVKKLGTLYGAWMRLAVLTGLRLGEQFNLKWADVDLERGILTLPHTKAGHVQYVHLNEEAKAILREFDSWQRSTWVFPSENPATQLDQRNFYTRVFVPAVQALKLEGVTWHTLRHTFASRLAMSGQGEGTIAALLRHSTTGLVRRYAHLSPTHLKAAVETVASFGKAAPTSPEPRQAKAEEAPISNGTVTKTVIGESERKGNVTEVAEKIGAGDGI
ncbi:MAG: tyrosine-type recombinase/integrase [Nitrospira sp.]|nr:tyrosine-type recombinase/integrase [Nitrospira sp.]MDH4243537.1 tyrosine-type recombinase/integrase [Nitrospira sp.]MDH4355580.1 tyrosine-type recombinase/integrase [Nitrospira sp.]MDH5318072.1 tyrosine-type recombinase/integrase [Nitrospira sp.]